MAGRAVWYRKRPMPLAKVSERVAGLDHEPTRWAGWTDGDLVKTALAGGLAFLDLEGEVSYGRRSSAQVRMFQNSALL